MTTPLSIWWFFDRPDPLPWRISPSDAMFRIFARILSSDLAVLILRPGGCVPVIRCSVFLQGSYIPISLSWFLDPENLSKWYDVTSFCENHVFWLGSPNFSPCRICPSDVMFPLFSRRYLLWLVIPEFLFPLRIWLQARTVRFWLFTYVTPRSKFTEHYALYIVCKIMM